MKISKNITITVIVIIGIVAAGLILMLFANKKPLALHSVEAKTGNITSKINLTGQVKASQGVDLAFEGSGKIVANYVKSGDKIYAGQSLVAIDSSLLQSQLAQAQAQLDALNMDVVKSKTDAGIQTLYVSSLSAAQKSVSTAKDILLSASDLQYAHFSAPTQQNAPLQDAKAKAIHSLLGQQDAGLWTSQSISQLNGGAYGMVQNAINNPTNENIDAALAATKTAIQDLANMLNAMPIDSSLSAADRSAISLAKTSINVEVMATNSNIQGISAMKVNNSATITTTNAQIEAAQANINAIKTQISKTVIRALFNGQVDKDNAVVGQMVSAGSPVITISNNNLEIDTLIPEIDLNSAKLGANANVTLDAFGNDTVFPATIISVDSAPTVLNGISVYGAKLKFKNTDDRIKTGMTANITVISDTHSNVLVVPKSAIIQQNGKYFVIVDIGDSTKASREINIGLSDDKNVEITSGLMPGEKILSY